jgi:hypothetical protein
LSCCIYGPVIEDHLSIVELVFVTRTLDFGTVLKDRLRPPNRPITHQGIHTRGYSEVR